MKDVAILTAGESGFLEWSGFEVVEDPAYFRISAHIKADWYEAQVVFGVSVERIREFVVHLKNILDAGKGVVSIINENGNFDLAVVLDVLGHVTLRGVASKSMAEEANLIFELESDRISLESFLSVVDKQLEQQEQPGSDST